MAQKYAIRRITQAQNYSALVQIGELRGHWRIFILLLHSQTLGLLHEQAYGLLALQTRNGACALGLDAEIGTIETGKKADLVFLDLSEFRMNSILADDNAERILEVVLQESASQQVSDVMINGEFYVREGHVLTYSEEDLAREGQTIFEKLYLSMNSKPQLYHCRLQYSNFLHNKKRK